MSYIDVTITWKKVWQQKWKTHIAVTSNLCISTVTACLILVSFSTFIEPIYYNSGHTCLRVSVVIDTEKTQFFCFGLSRLCIVPVLPPPSFMNLFPSTIPPCTCVICYVFSDEIRMLYVLIAQKMRLFPHRSFMKPTRIN